MLMVLIEANIFFSFFRRVLLFQRRKRMNSPPWNDTISSAELVGGGQNNILETEVLFPQKPH